ncbi:SPOR domain-containing protein [Paracoccus sp. S1E-3]|uniref:SPOR domain-containing protein n=1 Tax=Paracoccus sp. S1E-3 TaxID=2756130 RepID=UPI0015EE8FEF|nr:SPOR domain-containing protein [Paracoccus sp. S1E-3]MBA4490181.1 SPOR domain-containing protein [Paracoccus sp. S1E-3]
MRQLVLFGLFWAMGAALAAAAGGRPAELPPADFPGTQYIDSAGCVFDRSGRDWAAKLGDDGAPLCGFPPSRSAWISNQAAATPAATLDAIERDLTISLVEAGGSGIDLSAAAATIAGAGVTASGAAPQSLAAREVPETPEAVPDLGIGAEISRALRAEPAMAARMAASTAPTGRLCELLGLGSAGAIGRALGADPTLGYCAGLAASPLPGAQTARGSRRRGEGRGIAVAHAGKSIAPEYGAPARAPNPVEGRGVAVRPSAGATAAGQGKGADTAPSAQVGQERIAATARYVQIGQFSPDGVTATIAALRAMGYPVARQTQPGEGGRRIILAGPFETRERLIAALDRLRRAGYAGSFAR